MRRIAILSIVASTLMFGAYHGGGSHGGASADDVEEIQGKLIVSGEINGINLDLNKTNGEKIVIDVSPLQENIYNTDGTLTEKRTVTQDGHEMVFSGGAWNTVTSKGDNNSGGVFKVEGMGGNTQLYQYGGGFFFWNSSANKDVLSYSPSTDTVVIGTASAKSNLWVRKQLRDKDGNAGEVGQVLTSTNDGIEWNNTSELIAGTLQEVKDGNDTTKFSNLEDLKTVYVQRDDLGTGMDQGNLEEDKINPIRWDNYIKIKDTTDGEIPDGYNRVGIWNGNWSSTITLPAHANYEGEIFVSKNGATNSVTIQLENTTLDEEYVIKPNKQVTAVFTNGKWDILSYIKTKHDVYKTLNTVTSVSNANTFEDIIVKTIPMKEGETITVNSLLSGKNLDTGSGYVITRIVINNHAMYGSGAIQAVEDNSMNGAHASLNSLTSYTASSTGDIEVKLQARSTREINIDKNNNWRGATLLITKF